MLALLPALVFIILSAPILAVTSDGTDATDLNTETIHITSQRLVADQNSQFVFFSGNVKAVQGATTIFSDSLKVFYQDAENTSVTYSQDSISKILALGNVRIEMDDKTAYCEQAVYMTETKSLTLSGEDTRIQSEGNLISGEKITIYQLTGQIVVDGSDEKKVQAVFQPTGKKPIPNIQ